MIPRRFMCRECDAENHNGCRMAACACCGSYDEPDPYLPAEADQLGREEDARLARQFGAWPDLPEASGR